ncbi:anthranilate synthase beta subunit 2, chloroplastic-like isoform X1 [Typha angustifolia]|uniref:anthranilate synthase beta subunit 2, chloroplastic-like isoform X1 n=1 Tax=Typha angustifolia TaxID=59011 RepID=UPI003C2AEC92
MASLLQPLYPKVQFDPRTLTSLPLHFRSQTTFSAVWETPNFSKLRNGAGAIRRQNLIAPIEAAAVKGGSIIDGEKKDSKAIIVIDNYDSFTYNLCQYIGELGAKFEVHRNDEITVEEIKMRRPRGILISPGPGMPQDSGISLQTVLELGPSIPLFGVCMGLQCIGEAFGGKVVRSPFGVVHGKSSLVYYDEKLDGTLFSGLPKETREEWERSDLVFFCCRETREDPFQAGRYHSLVIEKDSFPTDVLEVVAWTDDGLIMAARHRKYTHLQGVQFHPESIITTEGKAMIQNFIKLIEKLEGSNSLP